MEKEVVCVTGGAGFLGQHIVKLLQEKADFVKEIRILDIKPYVNELGHSEEKLMKSVVCDLRHPEEVREALRGADSVIHTAGVVSFGTFPDRQAMEEVNVKGTANLLDACVEENVKRVVFTSTIDVVVGSDEIIDGDENLPIPETFLFPDYPETKYKAETMILAANGRKLSNGDGSRLSTLALRPNVMYGEGDPFYIPNGLKNAAKTCGVLPRIGDGKALFQQAYAGNMAWGHVVALSALRSDAANASGHVYFLTDDTPLANSLHFMEHFLKARGFSLSKFSIPYPFIYGLMYLTESALWALSPLYKINMATPLCSIVYINTTIFFNRSKAEERLGYKPLYDWKESLEKSMRYYMDLEL